MSEDTAAKDSAEQPAAANEDAVMPPKKGGFLKKAIPWAITIACFAFLYTRIAGPAAAQDMSVIGYLASVFASVNWLAWLALMVPYSLFFFLIDSAIVWRVINWFDAKVAYKDILPVRASTYVISIVNEQVGRGAMALYLNRPGPTSPSRYSGIICRKCSAACPGSA